jgi:hypothetical protein
MDCVIPTLTLLLCRDTPHEAICYTVADHGHMTARDQRQEAILKAYRDLFDRVWEAVDAKVWGDLLPGLPWQTPLALREAVEKAFLAEPGLIRYDPRRSSDRGLLASSFCQRAAKVARASRSDFLDKLGTLSLQDWRRLRRRSRVSSPTGEGEPFKTPGVHTRNLELAWFVVERVIPFTQLLKGDLKPGRHGPRVAVPWVALAEEWNALASSAINSGYYFRSGRTLKDEYYRAMRNSGVVRDLLKQLRRELAQAQAQARRIVDDLLAAGSAPPQSDAERRAEIRGYLGSSAFACATREEQIACRLFLALWLEDKRDTPLRHWFLPAATAPLSLQSERSSDDQQPAQHSARHRT